MAIRGRMITAAEAASILGVKQATVNKWALDGRLPVAQKLPGLRGANLFDPEDVEALRDARASGKTPDDEPDGATRVA